MNHYNFPFSSGDKVIELGGGERPHFRPNVDVREKPNVDIVADFNEPLPIESNKWDGVYSSYCIEHLSWRKVKPFLNEINRILRPGGKVVFITANTEEQMRWVLDQDEWDDRASSILFGDQDYEENTHRNSLSPKFATKLLQEAGFCDVTIIPWGQLKTDMIIEAKKGALKNRKELFDKDYFNGGKKNGGYAREGYWDYPCHWATYEKILEENPQSVLELGCSRGYLIKRIQDKGINAAGLEISKHCFLTRVANNIVEWDICETPWIFPDKSFDLCFSIAVLEHIPEEYLDKVIQEIKRVSKRGLHGIDFGENDDGFDQTHCTLRTKDWWLNKLPEEQKVVDKENLENGNLIFSIPSGDEKLKLNIGSPTLVHNGWVNVGVKDLTDFAKHNYYKFLKIELGGKIPFDNNSVDLISSNNFIEELDENEGLSFLKECRRVMKQNAIMRLGTTDSNTVVKQYSQNKLKEFDELNDQISSAKTQAGKMYVLISKDKKTTYDWESICELAKEAGFTKIEKKNFREGESQIIKETFDTIPSLNLYLELRK